LTDEELLRHTAAKGRPVILSTGMSTQEEIQSAVDAFIDIVFGWINRIVYELQHKVLT